MTVSLAEHNLRLGGEPGVGRSIAPAARERMNSDSLEFRKMKQVAVQAAEEEIDTIVMDIYGLPDREVEVVYESPSDT